jgi:hypothetical protein
VPNYVGCSVTKGDLQMSEELTRVDRLIDDDLFLSPFREMFSTCIGSPTIAIAAYLRIRTSSVATNWGAGCL